jgi:DNA repair protein SbcC/Rad50
MRILKIRFQNLNSLNGKWELDLTVSDYASDGIFAITGPTGAGKSTILDAICLALYGRTPRLGKVTKGSNEIMSRRSGESFAELEFESNSGRYRCNWSQRRAYGKSDGDLQAPLHTLSDILADTVLENRLSEVSKKVEELTGMDFHRFTRSILLAQGGFAAFLQASGSERAPILEQITGTEIYGAISTAVFERHRQEEQRLRELDSQLGMIHLLSDVDETQIRAKIQNGQIEIEALKKELQERTTQKLWRQKIHELEIELQQLTVEEEKVQKSSEIFAPQLEKLQLAEIAAELEADYTALLAARKASQNEQEALIKLKPQLQKAEAEAEKAGGLLIKWETKHQAARESLDVAVPVMRQVRELDLLLKEKERVIGESRQEIYKIEIKRQALENQLIQLDEMRRRARKEQEKSEAFLQENQADESLIGHLSIISDQCRQLQISSLQLAEFEKKMSEKKGKLKKSRSVLQKLTDKVNLKKEKHTATQEKLLEKREILQDKLAGRLLREYQSDLRHLEKERGYHELIASFEAHRQNLIEGEPCPLCGSEIHPWAVDHKSDITPIQQEIDKLDQFLKEALSLQQQIEALEKSERQNLEDYLATEREKQEAEYLFLRDEAALENDQKVLVQEKKERDDLEKLLLDRLKNHQIHEIAASQAESLIPGLEKRLQQYQNEKKALSALEKQLQEFALNKKNLEQSIAELISNISEKNASLEHLLSDYAAAKAKRELLFGNKEPDKVEANFKKELAQTEKEMKQARQNNEATRRALAALNSRLSDMEERLNRYETRQSQEEEQFTQRLGKSGFTHEDDFLKNRLPADKRKAINEKAKEFEQSKNTLAAQIADRLKHLNTEIEKKLSQDNLEELTTQADQLSDELTIKMQNLGAALESLENNKKKKMIFLEKQKERTIQAAQLLRWAKLNHLIGSASGNKYRNFAQNITFDIMIEFANEQLVKMSDRYLLARSRDEQLELNVIDKYQGGIIRSSKNLSGGESFLVSLALALGLSAIASRKVRVDSLFLDEGFGTLDDEALHTALETLAELRQQGKLIGIISHVAALKERIPTQVQVIKKSGGISILKGPGVTKI